MEENLTQSKAGGGLQPTPHVENVLVESYVPKILACESQLGIVSGEMETSLSRGRYG